MKLETFQNSVKGEKIGALLCNLQTIEKMVLFSRKGKPALEAIAADIDKAIDKLDNTEKQHIGRWVHHLLGPRGWRPVEQKRFNNSRLFSSAAVYDRVADADGGHILRPLTPIIHSSKTRLAKARQKLAKLNTSPQSVAAFVAEKRRDAGRC